MGRITAYCINERKNFHDFSIRWDFMKRFLKILIGLLFTTGFHFDRICLISHLGRKQSSWKKNCWSQKIVEQNNNDSPIAPSSLSYKKEETIGISKIPKLKKELPIIEGTDEEELEKRSVITQEPPIHCKTTKSSFPVIGIRCLVILGSWKLVIRLLSNLNMENLNTKSMKWISFRQTIQLWSVRRRRMKS